MKVEQNISSNFSIDTALTTGMKKTYGDGNTNNLYNPLIIQRPRK